MTQLRDPGAYGAKRTSHDPLRHLPPIDTRHWLPSHKAAVVAAVRSAALSLEEACERYMLTAEEFLTWKGAIDQHGIAGLKANVRERRKAPRQSVSEPGTLMLTSQTKIDCVITNISDAGARVRLGVSPSLPSTFELLCHKSKRSWEMDLVWQNGRSAGLRFHNPLPPPWTIKSGLGMWLIGKRRTVCIDRNDAP